MFVAVGASSALDFFAAIRFCRSRTSATVPSAARKSGLTAPPPPPLEGLVVDAGVDVVGVVVGVDTIVVVGVGVGMGSDVAVGSGSDVGEGAGEPSGGGAGSPTGGGATIFWSKIPSGLRPANRLLKAGST